MYVHNLFLLLLKEAFLKSLAHVLTLAEFDAQPIMYSLDHLDFLKHFLLSKFLLPAEILWTY